MVNEVVTYGHLESLWSRRTSDRERYARSVLNTGHFTVGISTWRLQKKQVIVKAGQLALNVPKCSSITKD